MIWSLAGALARQLPGEAAHRLAVAALARGIAPRRDAAPDLGLATAFAGMQLPNPLGLAAGFDKNAEAMAGALRIGFGFVEVGTITPQPQPGNDKPRVFRLNEDRAVINRYGFNNEGMLAAASRLDRFRASPARKGIVGVNIGANKDSSDRIADYQKAAAGLARYADYMTVNVSSPNTPGLRGLQQRDELQHVLAAAAAGMAEAGAVRPLVLKIAPDLDEKGLAEALDVALENKLAAVIIANTTISRPGGLKSSFRDEAGGLSGAPLFDLSSAMLARAAQLVSGEDLPLIAAGGVDDAATAYAKILLGASLVQLYTGLALKGALLPSAIIAGLGAMYRLDGYQTLQQAKGQFDDVSAAIRHARSHLSRASG